MTKVLALLLIALIGGGLVYVVYHGVLYPLVIEPLLRPKV